MTYNEICKTKTKNEELTIDDVFEIVDYGLRHGDGYAYQAYDRVFIVEHIKSCHPGRKIRTFIGNEMTQRDVGYDTQCKTWYIDGCGPSKTITLSIDGHVIKEQEEE